MLAQIEGFFAQPFVSAVGKLALLILLLLVFRRVLHAAVHRIERRLEVQVGDIDRRRRLHTLLRTADGTAIVVVTVIVLAMALELLGLNIGPLLASAGVAGLAISLAATTMIQDYIGGMIILAEDQFRVGDVVELGGAAGEVVRMTLRATYLRDAAGKLYTVPNGSVRVISNLTRDWSRALVDLTLEYETDFARVDAALQVVTQRLKADSSVAAFLIGDPETVTWSNLTEWGVQVRLMVKTLPGKQWAVGRMLRRYAIEALQAEGLRIAFPITIVRSDRQEPKHAE